MPSIKKGGKIMKKSISGFCPTQNKEYSITIDYVDASSYCETCYEKGTFKCDYNIYGDKCSISSSCPLYSSAPREIY